MVTKWILWGCFFWLPILYYFLMINETKFKKNLAVGVTLPYAARTDPQVLSLLERFKKQERITLIIPLLLSAPPFFFESIALSMTYWMSWTLFALFLPHLPFVKTNLLLKRLKAQRGWQRTDPRSVRVDLSAVTPPRLLSARLFLPAFLLSLLPLLWERDFALVYAALAATQLFFLAGCRYLYRNKAEMVDDNTQLTRVLTQVRRRAWGVVWLLGAYGTAAIGLLLSVFKYHPLPQLIGLLLVTFVITLGAIRVELRVRAVQQKLTEGSGKSWYTDEDEHWIGGLFYYNPDDARLLVNARVGLNTTFNLARPAGKVLTGALLLLLLALPFTGLYIRTMETAPLELELTETQLIASYGGGEERVERADIAEVLLMDSLPERMSRRWGTAMENLLSGKFSAPQIGAVNLSLDPKVPPFLLITLRGGERYLLGSRVPEQTEEIFRRLTGFGAPR